MRQNPIHRTVRSVHVCAVHCVQLLHTILHRRDLIIFPLTLQKIIRSNEHVMFRHTDVTLMAQLKAQSYTATELTELN